MRTREKGYDDYGLKPDEVAAAKLACRSPDIDTRSRLFYACMAAKPEIALDLAMSLAYNLSFERITANHEIYTVRDDFYGYRRKALWLFWKGADE